MNRKLNSSMTIAIIGAGPAGSMAAAMLAKAGHRVLLFERKAGAWEKPCGGGVTAKGVARYPFLRDALTEKKIIRHVELFDHTGHSLQLPLRKPLYVYSRQALNALMLNRALSSGATLIPTPVKALHRNVKVNRGNPKNNGSGGWLLRSEQEEFRADFVVVANGANSALAESLAPNFSAADFSAAMGYHLPIRENFIRLHFFKQFRGYLWTFPRNDHVSLGIVCKLADHSAESLKSMLQDFCRKTYGHDIPHDSYFYSALVPTPGHATMSRMKISGSDWALVGDAAGLVDPLTCEGIYFALRSGELLAQTIMEGANERFTERVREDFGLNLAAAAKMMPRFYTGRFLGDEFTSRMLQFARLSGTLHSILAQLFEEQDYLHLKRRLLRHLLRSMLEAVFHLKPPAQSSEHRSPTPPPHRHLSRPS